MSHNRDSSPVYYREIQKNAYLRRLPDDLGGKLRPLALKKPPPKPLWTQLCVHNGRTPYLEQYRDPTSARAHRPVWRACLLTARHVTASVTSRDNEYDFLVDTDQGPVRMLAPDWESMQDWVSTLRSKLHELKIVPLCENVYCAAPAAPAPRAAARDPTSPLPPTPPVPPHRVPGIEIAPVRPPQPEPTPEPDPPPPPPEPSPPTPPPEPIDISSWDEPFTPTPSTSQVPKSVTKICGQNICLDNSIFKRSESDDDEFGDDSEVNFKQMVVVSDGKETAEENGASDRQTNITVIKVSNKEPPHTAIPVIGPETDVFDFDFKHANTTRDPNFVNIVNTEVNVQNSNEYGTVFTENEPEYGHLSLTTTVSLTGDVKPTDVNVKSQNEGLYERLCLASTSNDVKASPLSVRKLKSQEKIRKSSLPNLDTVNAESTYEYLFLSQNSSTGNITSSTAVTTTISTTSIATITTNSTTITPISTTASYSTVPIPSNTTSVNISNTDSRVNVQSVSIEPYASVIRSNIERTQSQNAYDVSPRREIRIEPTNVAKRNGKFDKSEPSQTKPIWKRGLTELSLLTRLRGIGQGKRPDSPSRNGNDNERYSRRTKRSTVTSPAKVVHRSRPEVRVDRNRRRSSSLSNGQSPPSISVPAVLQPLRARQAAMLRSEQRRGAALVAAVRCNDPPIFADYNKQVWVCQWGSAGPRCQGRVGDRICGIRNIAPRDAAHAKMMITSAHTHLVDILFHRVPLGKIYVVIKRDQESIGIKLDNECNIISVEGDSPAGRAGIPPPGKWAVTEVNNRPVNLVKGGEEDMNRLSLHGTEASVLIQPSALVKKLRAAIKGNKNLLGLR